MKRTLFLLLLLCSVSAFQAQNFGIVASSIQTGGGSFTGILDDIPGAGLALSFRRLSSSYTGPLIRIVRLSDDTETDINDDGSGDLDVSAINSFCSGTTCYLGVWYDQSGNSTDIYGISYDEDRDQMPVIYESGSVITVNGLPAVQITHPRTFQITTTAPLSQFCAGGASGADKAVTAHMVGNQGSSTDPYKIVITNSQDLWFYENSGTERTDFIGTSAALGSTFTDEAQKVWCWQVAGNTFEWFEDGSSIGSSSNFSAHTPTDTNMEINIGGLGFSSRNMEGFIQEVIIWPSVKSASDIFSNADTYYSIP